MKSHTVFVAIVKTPQTLAFTSPLAHALPRVGSNFFKCKKKKTLKAWRFFLMLLNPGNKINIEIL
jgi:hypothetical protein